MGKFPVTYMGSLSNGVCMGGLVPVVVNIVILSMDVDIQASLWFGDHDAVKLHFKHIFH